MHSSGNRPPCMPAGGSHPTIALATPAPAPAHLCDQVEGFIGAGGVRANLVGVGGQAEGALGASDGRLIGILIHTQHLVIVAGLGCGGRRGWPSVQSAWHSGLNHIIGSCAADGEPGKLPHPCLPPQSCQPPSP